MTMRAILRSWIERYFSDEEALVLLVVLIAGLGRLDPVLEEAAATLGATRPQVLRRVVLPALAPALLILASGAFVLFMGGLRWRWIISVVAAAVPVAVGQGESISSPAIRFM